MFGALSLFFWLIILLLCGFDSLDKNREKNKLRKDAQKKGYAYYWANGKMYHTASNKQCYSLADDDNDMILYEVGTGVRLCNASEVARQRENLIYEKRKKQKETLEKFNQLPEADKNKIRTKIAVTKKEKRKNKINSKIKDLQNSLTGTIFMALLGGATFIMIGFQNGFESFLIKFIAGYLTLSVTICAILYFQIKKMKEDHKEELR